MADNKNIFEQFVSPVTGRGNIRGLFRGTLGKKDAVRLCYAVAVLGLVFVIIGIVLITR